MAQVAGFCLYLLAFQIEAVIYAHTSVENWNRQNLEEIRLRARGPYISRLWGSEDIQDFQTKNDGFSLDDQWRPPRGSTPTAEQTLWTENGAHSRQLGGDERLQTTRKPHPWEPRGSQHQNLQPGRMDNFSSVFPLCKILIW